MFLVEARCLRCARILCVGRMSLRMDFVGHRPIVCRRGIACTLAVCTGTSSFPQR